MNSTTIPSAQQVAKYVTLLIVVLSAVDLSVGLPSSSNLVNNRLFSHMIRTRSLPKRYCGRHIVNMLSMLCDGNYFSPSKRNHLNVENKKDVKETDSLNNAITSFWDEIDPKAHYNKPEEDSSEDYFLDQKNALQLYDGESSGAEPFSRKRRGIVDECCRKACTIRELSSYCE